MTSPDQAYGVAIEHEGDDYHVVVRDLPEVVTAGDTLEEALELAADAIAVVLAGRREHGMPVPPPSPIMAGEYPVRPLE